MRCRAAFDQAEEDKGAMRREKEKQGESGGGGGGGGEIERGEDWSSLSIFL